MKIVLKVVLLCLLPMVCLSQTNLISVRKEIPVKKVVSVDPVNFHDELFVYKTKTDTGLWHNGQKKVLLHGIKEVTQLQSSERFVRIHSNTKNLLFDKKNDSIIFNIKENFWIYDNADTNALVVFNNAFHGFLDLKTGAIDTVYVKGVLKNEQPRCEWLWADTTWTDTSAYELWELIEYNIPDYYIDKINYSLWRRGKYLVLDYEYANNDSIIVLNATTGNEYKRFNGNLQFTKKWLIVHDRGIYDGTFDDGRTYYDYDFNKAFDRFEVDDLNTELLSNIIGENVDKLYQLRTRVVTPNTGLYRYKCGNKWGIYSLFNDEDLIDRQDFLFEVGEDIYRDKGFTFYLVNEPHYGLFNTHYGVELEPKYKTIALLALPDGSYTYLADGKLFKMQDAPIMLKDSLTPNQQKNLIEGSVVVHHCSELNNKLLVSGRFAYRDDHDQSYYTQTEIENNYGIIGLADDTTYLTGKLHTVVHYKNHYIIETAKRGVFPSEIFILNTNLDTLVLNDRLKGAYIWHDMFLSIVNGNWCIYDVESWSVKKTLGKAYNTRDFQLKDGYLLLGHNEYRRGAKDFKFDIANIITPNGDMVSLNGKIALHLLGNDLLLVGYPPKSPKLSGRFDFVINRHYRPESKAIFDLKTGKLLCEWTQIGYYNNQVRFLNEAHRLSKRGYFQVEQLREALKK